MIDTTSKFYATKTFNIGYGEIDYNKILKPSSLLNLLQDMACYSAEKCGFGYSKTVAKDLNWFVLKYHLEFNNYPQDVDNIKINTEARGVNRAFASRDFEVYNADKNELLGRAISQWTLVNSSDKSMVNPMDIFTFINKVEKREDDLSFNRIQQLERIDYKEEFKIRYDDIDVNRHVNNVSYLTWGIETLPKEFKERHKIKTLDIAYKKEIQYGNNVLSEVQIDDLTVLVQVKNKTTDEILCLIKAEYTEI